MHTSVTLRTGMAGEHHDTQRLHATPFPLLNMVLYILHYYFIFVNFCLRKVGLN